MDYLLLPKNPIHGPVEVPFHCTENYDGGDFFTYPDRQGWGPRSSRDWRRIFKNPSKKFLGFLQTWLFFGAMEAVFERPINISEFACQSNSSDDMTLTMAQLKPLLYEYTRSENRKPPTRASVQFLFFTVLIIGPLDLGCGYLVLDEWKELDISAFLKTTNFTDSIDPRIILSMSLLSSILIEALARRNTWGDQSTTRYMDASMAKATLIKGHGLIYDRMRRDGWCPSELFKMMSLLNTSALYFMSHIERPDPFRKHHMIHIKPKYGSPSSFNEQTDQELYWSGELCKEYKCNAYHFDDKTYQTKHVEGCTGCYEMVADYQKIFDILKTGFIPLVLSIDEADDSREITLVESGPDVNYVAISHVWSDGLGNVQRSALPRCQMLRISNLVRSLPGKFSNLVVFWIDTIGCPPDAANKGEAQNLAISMMRQTYENAFAVLVLESWLQTTNVKQITNEEAIMRILCSGWNSRLWTLQEGALARNLLFQFADVAYEPEQGFDQLDNLDDPILKCSLRGLIWQRMQDFRGFRNRDTEIFDKLIAVIHALAFRSTSVVTDEALCLAALLDMDIMQFVQVPPEDRMIHFWRSFDNVPARILFLRHPKLEVQGLRWAPSTLLRGSENGPSAPFVYNTTGYVPAKPTTQGLLFQQRGMLFWISRLLLPQRFYVRTENSQWYVYECDMSQNAKATHHQAIDDDKSTGGFKIDVLNRYGSREIAYIASGEKLEGPVDPTVVGASMGLLFAVKRKVNDVIYGRVLCTTTEYFISRESRDYNTGILNERFPPQARYSDRLCAGNVLNSQLMAGLGETKEPSQWWCVE